MGKSFKFDPRSINLSYHTDVTLNKFDTLLRSEWDRALAQGLFKFEIKDEIKLRIVDGDLRFVIELNPGRYEKRRPADPFERVDTTFNRNSFNFNKIKNEEVLFSLDYEQETDRNLIIINASPISSYHVLLVPDRQLELPQILTVNSLLFGLYFVASSTHPFIYVGFNSLCGTASINHLHLHGIYMPDRLLLQTVTCSPFHIKSNCYLYDLLDTQAFVFEIKDLDDFARIARCVCTLTDYLTTSNIAHNLSIMKGDSFSSPSVPVLRIFIWSRRTNIGAKLFDRCNIGCPELSGYMCIRYEKLFNEITELELREVVSSVALPFEEQENIKEDVKNLLEQ